MQIKIAKRIKTLHYEDELVLMSVVFVLQDSSLMEQDKTAKKDELLLRKN